MIAIAGLTCEIVSIIMDVSLSESDYAKIAKTIKIICLLARILISLLFHYSKR